MLNSGHLELLSSVHWGQTLVKLVILALPLPLGPTNTGFFNRPGVKQNMEAQRWESHSLRHIHQKLHAMGLFSYASLGVVPTF